MKKQKNQLLIELKKTVVFSDRTKVSRQLQDKGTIMAEQLRDLVLRRGQIKAKLTRFQNYLESFTAGQDNTQLKLRCEKITQCFDEFEAIQGEIEMLQEGDGSEMERQQFENTYFELVAKAESFLSKGKNESVNSGNTNNPSVRLPVLNLPVYSGSFDQWYNFAETFSALISKNETLSDIQKFHYLRTSVKGEALEVIQSLDISAENYETAWELLRNRYENKKYIVNKHVKSLFELHAMEKETASALKQLLDGTIKHLRALKNLGLPTEHWDTIVVHLVSTKLDITTLREWEKSLATNELPTTDQLVEFLTKRIQVLEALETNRTKGKQGQMGTFQQKPKTEYRGGKIVSMHVSQNENKCKLCEKLHPIYMCEKFKAFSVSERIKHVKKLSLCLNCLKPSHMSKDCLASTCKTCHKKHNTLLHYSPVSNNTQTTEETEEVSGEGSEQEANQTSTTCVTQSTIPSANILLATAVIFVRGANG